MRLVHVRASRLCVLALLGLAGFAGLAPVARAEVNPPPGTDLLPVLGYSTWSYMRLGVSASKDEAEALALQASGLEALGYDYFNQDDGWYVCPGRQGPSVDRYGRWITNAALFPPGPDGENGIAALAAYVHGLGLRFGIYVTPGISKQAVAQNTPTLGAGYTADQIATSKRENNYNCGGMVGLDYAQPGAQAFVDSMVDEFASWGVDYIKLDGITDRNAPDIVAWSNAIRQSGRPMQLDITEGHYNLALANTLDEYATQWEVSEDIECYECETGESPYPLTDYRNVKQRFTTLAGWQAYAGSQFDGYNDFDSVELGNCADDGLDVVARETVMSLWALASSPLIIGANLTELCATDLQLLQNTAVLAVDQDGISALPVVVRAGEQVIAKTVKPGEMVVGLFDTGAAARKLSISTSALGMPACARGYTLENLWSQAVRNVGGTITASVSPRGVALFDVTSRC